MKKFLSYLTLAMCASFAAHPQASYKISSASAILISGTSTLSDWTVRSKQVAGEMAFAPSGKVAQTDPQTGIIKTGKAVIEVATIKSEKGETMDNKMYSALKKDTHPQISFLLTQPVTIKGPGKVSVTGNVEIAGVIRPMTFDLNLTWADNALHLQGSRSTKLSEFEIEPPTAMFGQIETGDDITVELDLFFVR